MGLPRIIQADSPDWMRDYAGEPFDAIVTDPPYGLAFMAKSWDSFKSPLAYQEWTREWAEAALGVVKPGAYLLVFGAPRLYHRMAVGIEDAGWEIRDCLHWLYGSGFPKSHNLAGDRRSAGLMSDRCVCGNYQQRGGAGNLHSVGTGVNTNCAMCGKPPPITPNNGYGTALKPAYEPIVLARAPFAGTVQGNYDAHGTGALHIDAARVPLNGEQPTQTNIGVTDDETVWGKFSGGPTPLPHDAGRWPANVVLDEGAAALLDAEFETLPTGVAHTHAESAHGATWGGALNEGTVGQHAMTAARADAEGAATGPSRFFYTSKASRAEREAGLRSNGGRANRHPSVKPIDLMRWLCRLAVPTGGRVLDPFAGSGSTLIAAHAERMDAVGLERDPEYVDIARGRIVHHCAQQRIL